MNGSAMPVRWVRVLAAWLGTIGRPVMVRAVPTWIGLAIVAGVTMQGNALTAADLVAIARSSTRALLVMAAAWLLLAASSVRAALEAPGAPYLRALPGGPTLAPVAIAVIAAVAHLPWAALWLAGGGAAAGALAWTAMVAVSLAIALAGGRLERSPRAPRWRGPIGALAGVHLRTLVRRRRAVLVAGAGLAATGGLLGGLLIDRNGLAGAVAAIAIGVASAIATPAAIAAATTVAARSDRELAWLVAASGAGAGARRAALALVLAGTGFAAGALVGGAALAIATPPLPTALVVLASAAAVGLSLGVGALAAARWAHRAGAIEGGRVVIALIGQAIAAVTLIGLFDVAGLAAVAAAALALALGGRR
jgi:hypothetical protein